MLEPGGGRFRWIPVLSLCAAALAGCNGHKEPTPEEVAQFKYCSGLTAAAERAAYRGLIDLETAGKLRAGQVLASNRLLLPAEEMVIATRHTDAQGNLQATTTTEVGRGLEEGHVMIDKNQPKELLDSIHTCNEFFAALVS